MSIKHLDFLYIAPKLTGPLLDNQTTLDYTDNYYYDSGDGSSPSSVSVGLKNANLTRITYPTASYVTYGYYLGTGQAALSTDVNGNVTSSHFYDSLSRPTSVKFPDSGWNYFVYPSGSETQVDEGTGITSTTLSVSCSTSGNACRHDQTLLDSLGRVTSQIVASDPSGQTTVATAYDSNGRVLKVSNPYRSTSDSTYGWTTPTYDSLDRIVQIQDPDGSGSHIYYGSAVGSNGGASSQSCSGYGVGYPTLKVDEAGKKLQSWIDGFGRTIEVDEPASSGSLTASTCYAYNVRNNLTYVQAVGATQSRSFSYDFLSRPTSAYNPESGTTYYYYTTSGGSLCSGDASAICRKTDANSNTIYYAYDGLNRLTEKSYSASGMPTSYYYYDQSGFANPIGRLTSEGTYYGGMWLNTLGQTYDTMGRVASHSQSVNGIWRQATYTYYYDGSVATIHYPNAYPTGDDLTYTYNSAQQPISLVDSTNTINYVPASSGTALYAPQGALRSLTNGSGMLSTMYYNAQLQPCRFAVNTSGSAPTSCTDSSDFGNVMDFTFNFNAGSSDNGNVVGLANHVDPTRSFTASYDYLNRLSQALTTSDYSTSSSHCWAENYGYDTNGLGNLVSIGSTGGSYSGCGVENLSISVNSTNQISGDSSSDTYTYDSDGQLTAISGGGGSFVYDLENHMTESSISSNTYYQYDSLGRRAYKTTLGAYELYYYDPDGNVLTETDASGNMTSEYIYFAGKRIARRDSSGNVFYYFADHLGTSRDIVQSGSTSPCYDAEFYPFGGERSYTNTCGQNYKFTSQERDSETTLDHFPARQFSSQYGRFMSPDPLGGDIGNPQSLNAYSYVRNNPLSLTDPSGMDPCDEFDYDAACPGGIDDGCDLFCGIDPGDSQPPPPYIYTPPSVGVDPNPDSDPTSDPFSGETNGIPNGIQVPGNLAGILLPVDPACEFTACDFFGFQTSGVVVQTQSLSLFAKIIGTIGCIAGLPPEYAKPIDLNKHEPPTDSTDTPEGHDQGQRNAPFRGKLLNPKGSTSEEPDRVAGGAAQAASTAACITSIWTAWPKQTGK